MHKLDFDFDFEINKKKLIISLIVQGIIWIGCFILSWKFTLICFLTQLAHNLDKHFVSTKRIDI